VRTGRNVRGPKIMFIKGKADDVPSYPVRVEGDDVLIDVGD
jgi:nitrite reductase/ring-hydroxylating ferredoxin subunit